jgi:hypothetical protein
MITMDRLAVILAEMIRSALAWEQQQGLPRYDSHKTKPLKTLTINGIIDALKANENAGKGEENED